MDEKLKIKFWKYQKISEIYKKNKYHYNTKAFIFTFIPSYLVYYNFYENSIRKFSFIFQFLAIYYFYKISLRFILELDIDKQDENKYMKNNNNNNNDNN
jgi:hypothetical protein